MKVVKATLLTYLSLNIFAQIDLSNVYKNLENGDYEEVISNLDQMRSNDKKFLETKHFLKGLSYSKLQEYERSILEFKKSIALGNNSGEIYYELGQVLYAQNELNLARKAFLKSIQNNFKNAQSNYYIGHISQLLEEYKLAKDYYSKILKDKETSVEMLQIARFQMSESMLSLARLASDTSKIVEKYILPQLEIAKKQDEKSQIARDIEKRISEIENEFGLNPNLFKNGRPIPTQRFNLSFSHELKYDNNYTLTSELPESSESKSDTFINSSELSISYNFIISRRFSVKPYAEFTKVFHSNREDTQVYANDAYTLESGFKSAFEHKAFKNPASFLINLSYNYNAEDRLSQKDIIFNDRSQSFEVGEKFKYFSFGESTLKFKLKNLTSYIETSDYNSTTVSFDQLIFRQKSVFIFLILNNATSYTNEEANNTNSTTFRLDYLKPNFLPKTMLNLGMSLTLLNYEDQSKADLRGTEKTINYNIKFTRDIRPNLSLDAEYAYTQNKSLVDESNYSKHETSLKINYNL